MSLNEIKQKTDLVSLAEQAGAKFHRVGNRWSSACPLHGGDNPTAFNIFVGDNGEYLYHCWTHSECTRDKKAGDVFDFVMVRDNVPFKTALLTLGGDGDQITSRVEQPKPQPKPITLPSVEWQAETFREVSAASDRLHLPQWGAARDFLEARKMTHRSTLEMFNFGCGMAWDSVAEEMRRAIYIPIILKDNFYETVISALKFRFIDPHPNPKAMRYTCKKGSRFTYPFGYQFASESNHTLFLIEGEFNGASVLLCNPVGVSVMSFGSERNVPVNLQEDAGKYLRVISWCDKQERAEEYDMVIGRECERYFTKKINGMEQDANQLLKDGKLHEFLIYALGFECVGYR